MSIDVKPLWDKVVVKRLKAAEKSRGGIILPEISKKKPNRGEVVAIGDGQLMFDGTVVPLKVKVGDIVLFAEYGGADVEIDGNEYSIFSERDILAVEGK